MRLPWRRDPLAKVVTEAAENLGMEQATAIGSWLLHSTNNCESVISAGTSTQRDRVIVVLMIDMDTAQAICDGIGRVWDGRHGE